MEITKNTLVEDVLKNSPALSKVFIDHGLPCFACGEAFWGTIEELARQHGIDADSLISALNEKAKTK